MTPDLALTLVAGCLALHASAWKPLPHVFVFPLQALGLGLCAAALGAGWLS